MREVFGKLRQAVLAILVVTILAWCGVTWASTLNAGLTLLNARMIYAGQPDDSFTDLVRFQDRFYCTFREAADHVSSDGKIRIISSADGNAWQPTSLIASSAGDLRDPKLTVTPTGRLMLSGCCNQAGQYQTMTWLSDDGATWDIGHAVGNPNMWIWSPTWYHGTAYGVGYDCTGTNNALTLYTTQNGVAWNTLATNLFPSGGWPNEASIVFDHNGTAHMLLRRDTGTMTAQLGMAKAPYTDWTWQDLGQRVGGPKMIELPDGRLLAAARLYEAYPNRHTALCWVDPSAGTTTEALRLPFDPTAGDCGYPGMVYYGDVLYVSYYAVQNGVGNIYLAEVGISPIPEPGTAILLVLAGAGSVLWQMARRCVNTKRC